MVVRGMVAGVLVIAAVATYGADYPALEECNLPSNFAVVDDPSLPPELARLPGFYAGEWGSRNTLGHTLVISEVSQAGNLKGLYAWATQPAWNITSPGCSPVSGTYRDGKIHLEKFTNGAEAVYRVDDATPLELTGQYWLNGRATPGLFKKVPAPR